MISQFYKTFKINAYGEKMPGSHGKQFCKGLEGKYCSEEKIPIKQQTVEEGRPK